jgi:hypothetical protein
VPLYRKQPLFRHVDEFMDRNGFQLIDIKRHYWKQKNYYNYKGKGKIIFADALYFKKIDAIKQYLLNIPDKSYAKAKVMKGVIAALIYGMFDYAVSLSELGRQAGYICKTEHEDAILGIKKCSRGGLLERFSLPGRIYNALNYFLYKVRPCSYLGWADSDRSIANSRDS